MRVDLSVKIDFSHNNSLKVLLVINSIFVLAANMFPPLFSLFVQDVGGNALAAGSIWAVFSIVSGVAIFIISRYGDRVKETELLIAGGYLLRAVAWIGYFFAQTLTGLYLLQVVLALGEAMGTPAFNAIYSRHLDSGSFVKEWGLNGALNAIIMGVAAFAGGFVVYYLGFRLLFIVMASLSLLSFALLMLQPKKLL